MRFDEMTPEQLRAIASKGGLAPHKPRPIREFCNRGHKLEGDNVEWVQRYSYNKDKTKKYTHTTYRCRTCMLEHGRKMRRQASQALRDAKRDRPADAPTHCIHGHPLTKDNVTYYRRRRKQPNGSYAINVTQVCLQCQRDGYKIRRYGQADEPDKRAETNKRLWTGVPNEKRVKP